MRIQPILLTYGQNDVNLGLYLGLLELPNIGFALMVCREGGKAEMPRFTVTCGLEELYALSQTPREPVTLNPALFEITPSGTEKIYFGLRLEGDELCREAFLVDKSSLAQCARILVNDGIAEHGHKRLAPGTPFSKLAMELRNITPLREVRTPKLSLVRNTG